ncbi:DUF4249 domain-containing protein [Spirosoma spitsbergense]|uniref:DUF4249 domain-containing protein n=1 Tax=Spirosoma spitsbergense TaxID=431554 RepID=UPI0003A80241|nr:DUF4249 domain-containing protein [Spirosoma spitsbergense]
MRIPVRIDHAFFALIGALLFWRCTNLRNEISPSLLGVESPKLVVTCFLSPQDTTLAVKVTRSATVVGDSISLLQTGNTVTNASVTLAQGDRSITLRYDNRPVDSTKVQPYYSMSAKLLPITSGQTYTLTVVTPNGQRASSSCTIPAPVFPAAITFDSLDDTQNRTKVRRYFVKSQWQDPANQANYYQVAGIFRYTTSVAAKEEKFNSLAFDDENRGLFTDIGLDGTTFVSGRAFVATSSSSTQQSSFTNQYKTALVTVNLMSIDQAYYRFQEAINRQRRSRNNPFAEPVLIPSNIVGGLGCFAGYNNAVLTKTLK